MASQHSARPVSQRLTRHRLAAPAAMALLATGVAVSPAAAQQRVIVRQHVEARERSATTFELEVERLARELAMKRQLTVALTRTMQGLQVALRNTNVQQLQRAQFEARLATVRDQLRGVEADNDRLRRQLTELCPEEVRPAGWVGIAYRGDISYSREGNGAVVTRFLDEPTVETVEPGSPAERAGLLAGDRIVSIAGVDVRDRAFNMSPLVKPGKKIAFKVQRANEVKTLTVTVERRPEDFQTQCGGWVDESIAAAFAPPLRIFFRSDEGDEQKVDVTVAPAMPTPLVPPTAAIAPFGSFVTPGMVPFAGAQFTSMDDDMADALGTPRGVLVLRVGRGSPAERSGLRSADVVTAVDGRATLTPADFLAAMERAESVRSVSIRIVRRKKPAVLSFTW